MNVWTKTLLAAAIVTMTIIAGTMVYFQCFHKRRLLVSTTTSLYDTGLLDVIEKRFEALYPIDLNFIAAGTGIAIQQAKGGDVDATLVHSPSLEKAFLEEGDGVCRKIVAYNFFTLVGPESDPAGIVGLNATEALKRIADYGANREGKVWFSRGDNSGTHNKEQSLWKSARFNYTVVSSAHWYGNAGSGMGETLLKAEGFSAYTLSDVGTYLKYAKDADITLKPLISERQELLNVYSVIAVNKTRHPERSFEDAITFIKFLVSEEGQQLIENFGKEDHGQSLFYGAVIQLKEGSAQPTLQWIRDYAIEPFGGSECPPQYRDGHPELYE